MNFDANGPPIRVIQVGLGGFGRSWAQLAHRTARDRDDRRGRSLSGRPGVGSQRA